MSRAVCRGVARAVLLTLGVLLVAAVVVPRLSGATTYTVLTGSMSPAYPPGTLLVVRPVPLTDIAVGSVVTYQLESGKATVVTHRVVEVSTLDGETVFRTQGDANPTPDRAWLRSVQVRGVVWYSLPHAGRLSSLLNAQQRALGTRVLVCSMFVYAAYLIAAGRRERRRSRAAQGVDHASRDLVGPDYGGGTDEH